VLNWLLIGIGDIATRRVIPALQAEPRSQLYGVVTRDPAKGQRYAPRVWTELEPALSDPAIDAVYVATPVALHGPQTVAALAAGRHVLCEKPMAMNYAEGTAMIAAARAAGKLLGVAYYRRLYPKLVRAQALLAEGAIGQPVLAEINCHDWFADTDGRRAWLLDPAMAGGGPLYDTASHRIDVLNMLFGSPVAVVAQLSNAVHQARVEDNATLLIEYPHGVRGVVDVRRHSHVARDEFRIVGTDGEMDLTPLNGPKLTIRGQTEYLPAHPNLHFPLVQNFVAAALDGVPLAASGEAALWTDWVISEALRAPWR
jgi:1,5-anhydro-D-fructose reductase (1,5-anhydro-D-mannitol-forming)